MDSPSPHQGTHRLGIDSLIGLENPPAPKRGVSFVWKHITPTPPPPPHGAMDGAEAASASESKGTWSLEGADQARQIGPHPPPFSSILSVWQSLLFRIFPRRFPLSRISFHSSLLSSFDAFYRLRVGLGREGVWMEVGPQL